MENGTHDPATIADRALERETALVDSAVEMVATGHAVRMQLGGLAFADALLDHARRIGAERGVRVTAQWGVGEEGLAMVFEPAGDAATAPGAAGERNSQDAAGAPDAPDAPDDDPGEATRA
jgi:hypothetical protein